MKNNAIKEKFIELRAQGNSFSSIAGQLKVSKPTLIEWSKELEHQVANLKAIELEALQEKYFIQKRGRIELFGGQVEAIKTEIASRGLKEVSTDKLFELLTKFTAILQQEETPVRFAREGNLVTDLTPPPEEWTAV